MKKVVSLALILVLLCSFVVYSQADATHETEYFNRLKANIVSLEGMIRDYNLAIECDNIIQHESYDYLEYELYSLYVKSYIDLLKVYYQKGSILIAETSDDSDNEVVDVSAMVDYLSKLQKDYVQNITNKYHSKELSTKQALSLLKQVSEAVLKANLVK